MTKHTPKFVQAGMGLVALGTTFTAASAAPLTVANSSFELPTMGDGVFIAEPTVAQQGGTGWNLNFTSSGIYNPPANTYATAGGNGTPLGADGIQVAFVNGGAAVQLLAGPDGDPITLGDNPVLTALTTYTLMVAVGRRATGNQYGVDAFSGYTISLSAGNTVIAQQTNAVTPTAGMFLDATLIVNSATLNSALYGSPLTITLDNAPAQAGVTDFDNVRLDATAVPEPSSALLLCAGMLGLARRRRS